MKLLSFGEILWDMYPDQNYIGGAPFNFAAHYKMQGGDAYFLSAVGNDDLGKEALEILKKWNIKTDYITVCETTETGKCLISLNENGIPEYNLLDNVAYDYIKTPDLSNNSFDALYFGSLALRSKVNKKTLADLIESHSFKEIFVDINIRKPYVFPDAIAFAFNNATVIKISDEELPVVTNVLFGKELGCLEASKFIAEKFKNIKLILITLGEKGSFAYDCKKDISYSCDAKKVNVVSTVGAGDSFSATFLLKYLSGESINKCLERASYVSAFVVSRKEAIPEDTPITN